MQSLALTALDQIRTLPFHLALMPALPLPTCTAPGFRDECCVNGHHNWLDARPGSAASLASLQLCLSARLTTRESNAPAVSRSQDCMSGSRALGMPQSGAEALAMGGR